MRDAQFGLEAPAVRPDVDELRRVVLARGRLDDEAGAGRGARAAALSELGRRERRSADEVRRQPEPQVRETGAVDAASLLEHVSVDVAPGVRQRDGRAGRAAEEAERAPVEDP